MSFDILESFNSYADTGTNDGLQTKWTILNNAGITFESVLAWGSRMLRLQQGSGLDTQLTRLRGASRSAFADGLWFMTNTLANWNYHKTYAVREGATDHLYWGVGSDGSIRVLHGNGTVLGTTASGLVVANTPLHIALVGEIHDTTGSWELYVNGVSLLSGSGVDTRNGGTGVTDRILLVGVDTSGTTVNTWFGEINCWSTNTFQGMLRTMRRALIASPVEAWSPSAGTDNYAVVDETVVSTADYLDATANGTVDEFTLATPAFGAASVAAVRLAGYGRSTDSTLRQINLQCISGATTQDGPNITLTALTNMFERYVETDPNTSAAWTVSAAEAFGLGLKLAA